MLPVLEVLGYRKNIVGRRIVKFFERRGDRFGVKELDIGYCKASYATITELLQCVQFMPKLCRLNLIGTELSTTAAELLSRYAEILPLTHLDISWVGLTSDKQERLYNALTNSPKLRFFAYTHNMIYKKEVPSTICSFLMFNASILHVDLSNCDRISHTELTGSIRKSESLLCVHIAVNKELEGAMCEILNNPDQIYDNLPEKKLRLDKRPSVIQRKLDYFCGEELDWTINRHCWICEKLIYKSITIASDSLTPIPSCGAKRGIEAADLPETGAFVSFTTDDWELVPMTLVGNSYTVSNYFQPGIQQVRFVVNGAYHVTTKLPSVKDRNEFVVEDQPVILHYSETG